MDSNGYMSYGECRCCLETGYHRDITKEYKQYRRQEVYIDIFQDCFNLALGQHPELTTLICFSCVERLLDANRFRKLVVDSENKLLEQALGDSQKHSGFIDGSGDKKAMVVIKIEPDIEMDTIDEDSSNIEFEIKPYVSDFVPEPDDMTLPLRSEKPPRQRERQPTIKRNTEKSEYIIHSAAIIMNSNATPFRSKNRTNYPCFYCREDFEAIDDLRSHNLKHQKSDCTKILQTMSAETFVVYLDIKDLKCTLCDEEQKDLNIFKEHLINVHSKNITSEYPNRIVPFCLENTSPYICLECGTNFETFGSLERHMNVHYRNYVCEECNSGYVSRYRLKIHAKSIHESGEYPCEQCGKVYSTPQKHKNHVNHVHKLVKRFKCGHCPERFGEYFMRHKHMVQEHGVAPLEYKCTMCDKVFEKRYNLVKHMRKDHLDDQGFQCEYCGYKCCVKHELTLHLIKHTGERIHQCTVCKKSYARKKTLREHMKIHTGERNHACDRCGMRFVQRGSLHAHKKSCKD